MRVTKLDSARRQLVTAVRLFFDGGDPVSIYSLATNAWEVIDVLCNSAGVQSLSNETREHLPAGKILKAHYINEPCRNFFKHADRDPNPDSAVELSNSDVSAVLILAVEDYIRLRRGGPVEAQVFQLWYVAVFPEKLAGVAEEKMLRGAAHYFPGIAELPACEQIAMGRRVLEAARNDSVLAADPLTESGL